MSRGVRALGLGFAGWFRNSVVAKFRIAPPIPDIGPILGLLGFPRDPFMPAARLAASGSFSGELDEVITQFRPDRPRRKWVARSPRKRPALTPGSINRALLDSPPKPGPTIFVPARAALSWSR